MSPLLPCPRGLGFLGLGLADLNGLREGIDYVVNEITVLGSGQDGAMHLD